MNPVIHAQAHQLQRLMKFSDAMHAHLFLEQTHLPYDVQDLILTALRSLQKMDEESILAVLEMYACDTSFSERILH